MHASSDISKTLDNILSIVFAAIKTVLGGRKLHVNPFDGEFLADNFNAHKYESARVSVRLSKYPLNLVYDAIIRWWWN